MEKAADVNIKSFYNSSDIYFNICQNRDEASFTNIIDVIKEYAPKGASMLEFGCGTGNLADLVSRNDYNVLGVDISDKFIRYAQETYASQHDNLKFQVVNFGKLPFKDRHFDCIYTSAVLEHCYQVDEIILDFDRLLKPGGLLVISTPNILSPFTRFSYLLKRLTGERKRYHLYGSPSFFFKSIWHSASKAVSTKPNLIYVTPNYEKFTESDEDVTFLSNHFDYLQLLKPLSYQILELARGTSKGGKLIAKLFPRLSGEVLIVARKK
ncbi:MAG: class I SAM-dependent methyltransferase [Chryseolinea sp.]